MVFVWSFWWIVIALLALGIVGMAVAFIMMDKKDAVLIDDFKKAHMPASESESPSTKAKKKD